MPIDTDNFEFVRKLLRQESGVVLDDGKQYLVETRLTPVAREAGFVSLEDFLTRLRGHGQNDLRTKAIDALTTNETQFFRDVHPFDALKTSILPDLIAKRSRLRHLNVWSAAASSGQEAYSLAMLLAEHFPELSSWSVNIIASDISDQALEQAQRGSYRQLEVNRGVPAAMLVKYFRKQATQWQISDEIRRRVEFRNINLIGEWPSLPPMDLVMLRNVLIYFDIATKRTILRKLRHLLKPDGYLLLGSAETTVNLNPSFEIVQFDRTVCYRPRG